MADHVSREPLHSEDKPCRHPSVRSNPLDRAADRLNMACKEQHRAVRSQAPTSGDYVVIGEGIAWGRERIATLEAELRNTQTRRDDLFETLTWIRDEASAKTAWGIRGRRPFQDMPEAEGSTDA